MRLRTYAAGMQPPSERTTIHRLPERGRYDDDTIHAILDEAMICHVGFATDDGPVVIPTIHARIGSTLYLHGSHAAGIMRTTIGEPVCIEATIVDGIVAARSLFNHSLNYRSVVAFGTARLVDDPEEREAAFEAITEHMLPGRWDEARHPSDKEDRSTRVVAVDIEEASAKVRTGPPGDSAEDVATDVWAGVIPIATIAEAPEPAPDLRDGIDVPPSISSYGSA